MIYHWAKAQVAKSSQFTGKQQSWNRKWFIWNTSNSKDLIFNKPNEPFMGKNEKGYTTTYKVKNIFIQIDALIISLVKLKN